MSSSISIRDLNKDVARLIIGNLEQEAYKAGYNSGFKDSYDKSKVYALYRKGRIYPIFCNYITQNKEKLENTIKDVKDLFIIEYNINPMINIRGAFLFIRNNYIFCLTNEKDMAKNIYNRGRFDKVYDDWFDFPEEEYKNFYVPFDMKYYLQTSINPNLTDQEKYDLTHNDDARHMLIAGDMEEPDIMRKWIQGLKE